VITMADPGLYLVNSTGEMVALATESGDGDQNLLHETLDEMDIAHPVDQERTFTIEVSHPDDDGVRVFDVVDEGGRSILTSEVHLQPGASLEAELNVKGGTEGSLDPGDPDEP